MSLSGSMVYSLYWFDRYKKGRRLTPQNQSSSLSIYKRVYVGRFWIQLGGGGGGKHHGAHNSLKPELRAMFWWEIRLAYGSEGRALAFHVKGTKINTRFTLAFFPSPHPPPPKPFLPLVLTPHLKHAHCHGS